MRNATFLSGIFLRFAISAGFLYAFDPDFCNDRTFSATVLVGGSFVESIIEAPDAEV